MGLRITEQDIEDFDKVQNSQMFHPLTCGGRRGDEAHEESQKIHGGDWGQLKLSEKGYLYCPACSYTQSFSEQSLKSIKETLKIIEECGDNPFNRHKKDAKNNSY